MSIQGAPEPSAATRGSQKLCILRRLDAHSDLPFHVIVNPNSGPGDGAQPDAGYQSALTKLRAYKNAQLYGYVRSQYGERAKSDVVDDVNTYQAWDSAYSLDGIFFDEASNTADLESTYNYYAEAVVGKVRAFGSVDTIR